MTDKKPKTLVDIQRDRSVTLERYLYRLYPRESFNVVPELLSIFFSVDVTLHRSIAQWLEPAFGWSRSSSLVQSALREMKCPLDFGVSDDGRPYLACFSRIGESDSGDSDILEVPYTSPDGDAEGVIDAVIHEGNLVNLRCQSAITWQVLEINAVDRKILLAVHKRREIHVRESHLAWCVSAKVRAARAGNVSAVVEKREFFPAELMGAIVWREDVTLSSDDFDSSGDSDSSADTESSSVHNENHERDQVNNSTSSRRCQVFQMPITPWENVVQLMKSLVSREARLHGTSKSKGPATAQIQPAGKGLNHKKIQSDDMVQYSGKENSAKAESSPLIPDVQLTKEEHAQAQLWLTRKRDLIEARRLLRRADPFSCCLASCRDRWMLTCRALRAICRGDEDLLDAFSAWTSSAGEEGALRAKDCRGMWRSLRPLTTADIPCVAQVRVFARAHMHEKRVQDDLLGKSSRGSTTTFSFRDIEVSCGTDPVLNSLISSAAAILSGRSLYFLSSTNECSAASVANCPPGAMVVPAVLYEAGELSPSCTADDRMHDLRQSSSQCEDRGRLLQSGVVIASISPGDVVLLPSFQSPSAHSHSVPVTQSSSSSRKSTWHRVVALDLLYARLRVSPCPSPPDCWSRHVTLPSVWAPISCLWAVPVCQLMPPTSPDSCLPVQYIIYVTPIPSLSASFAALASLPRKDEVTPKAKPGDKREGEAKTDKVKKVKKKKKKEIPVEIFYKEKTKRDIIKLKREEQNLTGICNPPLKLK